ncbi:chemotaxis protein CheW [Sphingobium lignivorans]|uniref:Purine-binding chemotaxis protein CheW n=1 Tax=Sphingobium lignivorans TaxID=2735886 RepID=A0ABR6NDR9_9SPHN|nr:chemotaxis protein CheW [Sphingobium lignivorans]MBB5985427.1 purine-binding chemotaxis protein CheW [Sphingobium lignivorans]
MAQAAEPLLAFHAGGVRYGIPAAQVRAVAPLPALTAVPLAPPALIGLANLRGEATPVIALSRLLDRPEGAPGRLLLIESSSRFALAIDAVEGVVGPDDAPECPPLETRLAEIFTDRRTLGGRAPTATRAREMAQDEDRLPLLRFMLGDQHFALPLDEIEQVLRVPEAIASLPRSDGVALGTLDYRGGLLPLLSLAALLALPRGDASGARILVAVIGQQRVGLLVDAVDRVIHAPVSRIDPVPAALLRGEAEAVVAGIYRPVAGERLVSVLAAGDLLSRDQIARLAPARPEASAAPGPEIETEALLLVRVGGHRLGFPLAAIDGVARVPERITRLPGAPDFLAGLGRLRGESCPIVDLPVHLGEVARPVRGGAILLCRIAGAPAGLKVDEVAGIVRAPAALLRAAGSLGTSRTRPFERVLALDGGERFALVLSADALFDQVEADLLQAFERTLAEPA